MPVALPNNSAITARGRGALGEAMAVLAIGRDDVVLVVERGDRADRDGLLTGVEMAEAGDFAARVHLGGLFLEAANQHHPPVKIEQLDFVHRQ